MTANDLEEGLAAFYRQFEKWQSQPRAAQPLALRDRWVEVTPPRRGPYRSCSISVGWRRRIIVEASLDTGYASRFEYEFTWVIGPWHYSFDWRPARRAAKT